MNIDELIKKLNSIIIDLELERRISVEDKNYSYADAKSYEKLGLLRALDLIKKLDKPQPQISEECFIELCRELKIEWEDNNSHFFEDVKTILEKYLKPQPQLNRLCPECGNILIAADTAQVIEDTVYKALNKPPRTQGDKIRKMSNEELAEEIYNYFIRYEWCARDGKEYIRFNKEGFSKYLQSEVKEDELPSIKQIQPN